MDAKVNGIQQFMKREVPEGAQWSPYHRAFEQYFYVPSTPDHVELTENIEKDTPESK
jgi:hypothetical protein